MRGNVFSRPVYKASELFHNRARQQSYTLPDDANTHCVFCEVSKAHHHHALSGRDINLVPVAAGSRSDSGSVSPLLS